MTNTTKPNQITYKEIMRFALHYWMQKPYKFALVALTISFAAIIDSLFPIVTGRLVDAIISVDLSTPDVDFISFLPKAVVGALILMVIVECGYHLVRNLAYWLWNKISCNMLRGITNDLFYKVQRFSTDWHANSFAGGTVRKITRCMWSFDTFEDICILYLLPTAVVLISIVVGMFLHWPIMGFVTLGAVAMYVTVSLWTVLWINAKHFKRSAKADTNVGASIADAITSNATVKAFGSEEKEDRLLKGVVNKWHGLALKSWQVAIWTDLLRRYVSILMLMIMMLTALWLWTQGRADTGDIVYVFTSFIVLSAYLRHIGEQISNMQRAVSEMEDGVSYWLREDEVLDAPNAKEFVTDEGKITFDHVTFAYDNQSDPIYNDFSITIKPGEKVALVGHSGSGKSTFVKLLQRLYDIQGGEIRIDGQNIAQVTQSSLRHALSLVPQDPILFHRTLADNIRYGNENATMEEVMKAAQKAYAHDFITELPQGYDTLVGERGIKLSGGERQRVALARAILSDTKVLILDEATSSLDSISEHYIQKALKNLMDGRTTITIAHRLSTIKDVDRILVFEKGRVIEQGTHDELLSNPESHYKELYDVQVLGLVGNEK